MINMHAKFKMPGFTGSKDGKESKNLPKWMIRDLVRFLRDP